MTAVAEEDESNSALDELPAVDNPCQQGKPLSDSELCETRNNHGNEESTEEDEVNSDDDDAARSTCSSTRLPGILIVNSERASLCEHEHKHALEAYRLRKTQREQEKRVCFGSLTVFEFPTILGDNPACRIGPPLTIAWKHQDSFTLTVEDYENTRPERRRQTQMIVPVSARQEILRRAGYARGEIVHLVRPVNIERQRRMRSRRGVRFDAVNELMERVMRSTKHLVTLGVKKRNERTLLEPYLSSSSPPPWLSLKKDSDLSGSSTSGTAFTMGESQDLTASFTV
jgi:hypothetical protein